MQSSTVGCDCPSEVPAKFKDLKWWSSAVVGKSRHSSHPTTDVEYTHFRECVAMDFLEFNVNGVKFHLQAFVDCKTSHAMGRVTSRRSTAPDNLLWYLNKTDAPRVVEASTPTPHTLAA